MKEGDRNYRYFHTLASHHRRCNYVEEMWVVRSHFMGLYEEEFPVRLQLNGMNFKKIGGNSRQCLEGRFSEDLLHRNLVTGLRLRGRMVST